MFEKSIKRTVLVVSGVVLFCVSLVYAANTNNKKSQQKQDSFFSHISTSWNKAINEDVKRDEKYPNKRKITPETVRLTINEYYIPQVSELLAKGVDYFEWLNKLDDPYLNRYKVDVKVDPDDERLKLFWKRSF